MATFSFLALLLLAVPVLLVAILGIVLVVVSRRTRLAGLGILTFLAVLLVGGFGLSALMWYSHGEADLGEAVIGADEWISVDDRPTDPDRADIAQIERYLDEVGSTTGIAADVDSLSPGEIIPPKPPPWVKMAAFRIDQIDYLPVASGPYATRDECRRALADAMKRAVDEYIQEYQGRPEAADCIDFDSAYIKTHLRHGDVYQEPVQASFGPMIQQHALLEFGQDFREEIKRRWKQVQVTTRLAHVSLAAAAILAGLATIFVYLRLDTATKGYYSGRLQIAAGAVILGLVAIGILIARQIPWL